MDEDSVVSILRRIGDGIISPPRKPFFMKYCDSWSDKEIGKLKNMYRILV
jgi:hypothetical protein